MFIYHIKTGSIYSDEHWLGTGYSGKGKTFEEGRNNNEKIKEAGIGPIPPGDYRIEPARNSHDLGVVTMDLTPLTGTNTFGRSLFRIHGNNASNNASHGCIILSRLLRDYISNQVNIGNNVLRVTAE